MKFGLFVRSLLYQGSLGVFPDAHIAIIAGAELLHCCRAGQSVQVYATRTGRGTWASNAEST